MRPNRQSVVRSAFGATSWRPLGAALSIALFAAGVALAQAPAQVTGPRGEVPPPPAGEGVIQGQVIVVGSDSRPADLAVALYALRSDGAPGLSGTRTDAQGRFVFEGISAAPDIVYLVGTEYGGVPFAQRVVFENNAQTLSMELALRESVESSDALEVSEVTYKFDWVGGQLFVQVSHRIVNPSNEVVYVREARRDGLAPAFEATLPATLTEYIDGQGGGRTDLVRQGERLAFWGPIYPGPQDLRYGYLLDDPRVAPDGAAPDRLDIIETLPEGAASVRVLLPAEDGAPSGGGLSEAAERVAIEDVEYASYAGNPVSPGGELRFQVPVPASSSDSKALRLTRADYWIDHDDTAMRVTVEVHISVAGSARLLAPPGGRLLEFALPPNAEFLGLTGSTRMLGVEASGDGGLAVRGPLAPGPSVIGYRYRIPVQGRAELSIQFERAVDLLNVLVADNGVIIESKRLHRKRPFKQGTRFYLHREAYQLSADELVSVQLESLQRSGVKSNRARWAALFFAAAAAFFLVSPLRRVAEPESQEEVSELALQREALYESIRDLDHDFETGKLDEPEFRALRDELRSEAIALMRQEEGGAAAAPRPASEPLCPNCGTSTKTHWSFCAECGHGLHSGKEPA
jgi:hypothetical protein